MRKKWVNMRVEEKRGKRSRTNTRRRVSRKKGRYLNFTRAALSIEITTVLLIRRIMVVAVVAVLVVVVVEVAGIKQQVSETYETYAETLLL